MTYSELLAMSLQIHNTLRGNPKRPEGWLDSLREAARLRQEAVAANPEMTGPGWEKHEQYMSFYRDKGVI